MAVLNLSINNKNNWISPQIMTSRLPCFGAIIPFYLLFSECGFPKNSFSVIRILKMEFSTFTAFHVIQKFWVSSYPSPLG